MEGRAPGRPGDRVVSLATRLTAEQSSLARFLPSGRSLAVGAALVIGAVLAYVAARETPMFALRTVTVEGAPAPVAAQVQSAVAPFVDSSLVTLDGKAVIARIEALPTVVSASYDRDFPHRLALVVRAERPVAVLRQGGASWLVSARGRVMRPLEVGDEGAYPRIWVDRGVVVELGGVLAGTLARTSGALAVLASSPLAGRVSTARLEDGRLTLMLRSGVELLCGRLAGLDLKLAVAERVLAEVVHTGPGSYLDVTVPERPVGHFNPQPEG
jgi:cell division protein FtsQ